MGRCNHKVANPESTFTRCREDSRYLVEDNLFISDRDTWKTSVEMCGTHAYNLYCHGLKVKLLDNV